jgi:hypothetical protein
MLVVPALCCPLLLPLATSVDTPTVEQPNYCLNYMCSLYNIHTLDDPGYFIQDVAFIRADASWQCVAEIFAAATSIANPPN